MLLRVFEIWTSTFRRYLLPPYSRHIFVPQVKGESVSETSVAVYQIKPSHISYDHNLEQRIFSKTQRNFNSNTEVCGAQYLLKVALCCDGRFMY